MIMHPTLLLIQNPQSEHDELPQHFESHGYQIRSVEDVDTAISLIDDHGFKPSAILVDLPEISASQMQSLESIDDMVANNEWVFLTYDMDQALVDRLEELSYQSLRQPASVKRIEASVKKAMRSALVQRRVREFTENSLRATSLDSIVGTSDVIRQHKRMLDELAHVPLSTLMINGETGTGKGHAAGVLHYNGLRKEYPLVEMNCAAMPAELVESQLFGHEAGAFSGAKGRHRGLLEQADNGTLFLDEIGEMPIEVQAKLLKAIEEQRFRRVGGEHVIEVDVQVFAASNQDLQQLVVEGLFREDLYHRLNVFEITVPSLREYKSDLVHLVPLLIAEFNAQSGKKVSVIPDQAWTELMDYDWPGNVRELKNALERSVLLARDEILNTHWLNLNNELLEQQLDDSASEQLAQAASDPRVEPDSRHLNFVLDGSMSLDQMDREIILAALQCCDFNMSRTAELLGVTRETIRYRVQKYQLSNDDTEN